MPDQLKNFWNRPAIRPIKKIFSAGHPFMQPVQEVLDSDLSLKGSNPNRFISFFANLETKF